MSDSHAPSPRDVARGAWTGFWTVLYGLATLARAAVALAWTAILLPLLDLGAATIRAETDEESAGAVPRRLAELLANVPDEFARARAPWIAVTAALGVATVVAGFGVLRRSDFARRAAVGLSIASALAAVGLAVHFAVSAFPAYAAWAGEIREIMRELERQGGRVPPMLRAILETDRTRALAVEAGLLTLHLGVVAWIVHRLRGTNTRAWCSRAPV